jgi:hypothetical protein
VALLCLVEERAVACHNTCVAVVALERCVLSDPYVLSDLKRLGMSFAGPLHQLASSTIELARAKQCHAQQLPWSPASSTVDNEGLLNTWVCVVTLHRPRLGANAPLHKP